MTTRESREADHRRREGALIVKRPWEEGDTEMKFPHGVGNQVNN